MNKIVSKQHCPIQGLYAITDPLLLSTENLMPAVELAIRGGARVIQYRNKLASATLQYEQARQLSALCKRHQICFIINDDAELAKRVTADGVHIGKSDGKITKVRKQLGDKAIIGVSCYNRLESAQKAIAQGADYVAFGRFFPSKTKPDAVQAELQLLEDASRLLTVPIVAIGGVTRNNATQLISHGADAIAVINDLFHDKQAIYNTAKAYQAFFN